MIKRRSEVPKIKAAIERVPDWGWCGVCAGPNGILAADIGHSSRAACETALSGYLQQDARVGEAESREGLRLLRRRLRGDVEGVARLDLKGTELQVRVWRATASLPRGESRTYAQVAELAGYPASYARAAGNALAANPVMVLVPCHRVTPASGGLGGFARGARLKGRLLHSERPAGVEGLSARSSSLRGEGRIGRQPRHTEG